MYYKIKDDESEFNFNLKNITCVKDLEWSYGFYDGTNKDKIIAYFGVDNHRLHYSIWNALNPDYKPYHTPTEKERKDFQNKIKRIYNKFFKAWKDSIK